MRDCLFFFSFFLCIVTPALASVLFSLLFFLSDVNLSCKKKRKNTSKLCWWSLTCLLRPGCDTESSLPRCTFEPETKTIATGARKNPRAQQHFSVLCASAFRKKKRPSAHPNPPCDPPPPTSPPSLFSIIPLFFSCCSLDLLDYVSCIIEDATVIVTHRPFLTHTQTLPHTHTHTHTQT